MKYYFIDLFCGAGGVTTGVHRAKYEGENIAEVIACVNHDATAIMTHAANHPEVLHYTEDIRTLDLTELTAQVQLTRLKDPDGIICLWASLECTNFSKAKGGMPRDADSRTLAEHLFRYIEQLNPDMVWIENVEEFMSWGPLDENGKPISRSNGRDYTRWVKKVKSYGYKFDHRILNAADYGAYTSRKRFFAQFAKTEIEIAWPVQTHAKKLSEASNLFSGTGIKKWKPVREVLNLNETGESIFIPGRIKSDKTFERIYHGLIKFVAGGKKEFEAFLVSFNSTGSDGNVKQCVKDIDNPAPTINTQGRLNAVFVSKYHAGKNSEIEVLETDMPHAILIKAFMVLYGLADVKMRMLEIIELLRIQGFGDDYKLLGSKTKQKWMLGNAVECNQATVMIEASYGGNIVNSKMMVA